jgi:peptidoglycan-associated lipoprotein
MSQSVRRFFTVFACSALVISLGLGCAKRKKPEEEAGATVGAGAPQESQPPIASGDLANEAKSALKIVHFALDKYTLSNEARTILQGDAEWLKGHPSVVVQIEGHCDERGSLEYNLALGEKRANSVKAYLQQLGIDASRLSTVSLGEERPVDSGHTEEAWSKNRRNEFVVLSQ